MHSSDLVSDSGWPDWSSCFGFSKFFQTNESLVFKVGHDCKIHIFSNSRLCYPVI